VNTVTPTPGVVMLRSLAGETECRPLTDARGDRWRQRMRSEVHVTVAADGIPIGAFMPSVNSRDEDERNRRIVSRYRFLAATLNGEPVQSVVVFGHDRRVPNRLRR
jgi:hypothetical protein